MEGVGQVLGGEPSVDVCIVGGGVIGCALARAILLRERSLRVCVIEKEPEPAMHQSGRNSGVVHAGYNQKPGTLKADFVVRGSRALRAYCRAHGVSVVEDGILVVASEPAEEATRSGRVTAISKGSATASSAQTRKYRWKVARVSADPPATERMIPR